ncbi:MAG: acyltransferase domain-containing protein [Nitrospirota bacterium]
MSPLVKRPPIQTYCAKRDAVRSTHLPNRLAVWGDSREALIASLNTFSQQGTMTTSAHGVQHFKSKLKPVFVYTGMGPQWWAMGQELYRENPVFKAAVETADTIFQEISGFSICEEMRWDFAMRRRKRLCQKVTGPLASQQ